MLKKSLVAIVFTIIASAALYAITMNHPAGFEVTHPDDWKQQVEGDILTIMNPDATAVIKLRVIEVNSIPEAVQGLENEVKKIVAKPKIENKPKFIKLNNLPALLSDGAGEIKGMKVKWLAGLFMRENKGLVVLGFANAKTFPKYKETLKQIINSISEKK
jgi:hypothetical protein